MEQPLFEVCLTKTNRVTRFVTKAELSNYTGFRSVYGFSRAVADYATSKGSTRGMKNFCGPVYADVLVTDFDDAENEAEMLYNALKSRDIGFDVYTSGSRSIHIEIPHQELWSAHLPYSHKSLLREFGVPEAKNGKPGFDSCLYQCGRLFRLPGTVHEKTMRPKVLLERVGGKQLVLSIVETPPKHVREAVFGGEGRLLELVSILTRYVSYVPSEAGHNRNITLFGLAAGMCEAGFSEGVVEELIDAANSLIDVPLDDNELATVVSSAKENFK